AGRLVYPENIDLCRPHLPNSRNLSTATLRSISLLRMEGRDAACIDQSPDHRRGRIAKTGLTRCVSAMMKLLHSLLSLPTGLWIVLMRTFRKPITVQYPEETPYLPPRWRGRIVLTRDPDGEERCVACYLCAVACPVDCIALQATEDGTSHDRRYPEFFRINFSRCIYCGYCEDACPTYAIQLIPDFEMAEYNRQNMVYEKEDLLINGEGKYPGYNFYKVAGIDIGVKAKGAGVEEE